MSRNAQRFHIGRTVRDLLQKKHRNRRLNGRRLAAAACYVPQTAVRAESLEDRTLLAGIHDDPAHPAWQLTLPEPATHDVLNALEAIGDIAAAQSEQIALNTALSVVDLSLNSLLNGSSTAPSVVTEALNLRDSALHYFSGFTFVGTDFPTVHGLAVAVQQAVAAFDGAVDVPLDSLHAHGLLNMRITIDHRVEFAVETSLPSPRSATEMDLELSGQNTLSGTSTLLADVALTVDLAALNRAEAAIAMSQLDVTADFHNTNLDASVVYHFIELTSSTSTSSGTATVSSVLLDPTPLVPGLTLSEFNGASSTSDLLLNTAVGSMTFTLPLSSNVTGFVLPVDTPPTVTLTDSTLFDGDVADATTAFLNHAPLQPFARMTAVQFQSGLESIHAALEQVDASRLLSAEILLTDGQTLTGLVDISQIFTDQVLKGLIIPGAMQLVVSSDVSRWNSITDGSIGLTVDGETLTLHQLDFSGVGSMSDVAAMLQSAINLATQRSADVSVSFHPSTSRTNSEGNEVFVPTLTITSGGIDHAAAVTSPAIVTDEHNQPVGTSLFGDASTEVMDQNGAEGTAAQPAYRTVQEFQDLIRTLTDGRINDVVFIPATGEDPASLQFQILLDEQLPTVRTQLDLSELQETQLSHLQTQSPVDLNPSLHAGMTVDVQLTPIGGDYVLTPAASLASLNAGAGVMLNRDKAAANQQADGFTDVQVTLRDGTVLEVNFDNASTVTDILNVYHNHPANSGGAGPGGKKFAVEIADDQQSLVIRDFTVGDTLLQVKAINSSLAAFSLGLVGSAAAEDDSDTPDINEATTIHGKPLHGRSVADHVLLSNMIIQPSVTLLSQSIDATARQGFVDLHITTDAASSRSSIVGDFRQTLSFSGSSISVADLQLDVYQQGPRSHSTVTGHVDLHATATVLGKFGPEISADANSLDGTVVVPADTLLIDYQAHGATSEVTQSGANDLDDLSELNFSDVTSALQSVSTLLERLMQTGAMGADLPLLGISVADVVSIGKEITAIVTALSQNPATSVQQLEELIEDALGLPDNGGVPVFALPEMNSAVGRSELNVVPDHFQTARLTAGDPVSLYLRNLDYLATQQHDSPEVNLSIDRSEVTRHVSDYSPAALQELLDRHGITLEAGQTTFQVPGLTLRLDFALDFSAANSFGASLDHDPETPGIQVPLHFNLQDLGLNLPSVIDVSGQSLITLDAGTTLQLSMGLDLTDPTGITPFLYEYDPVSGQGTTIVASLTARADEVSFQASIGPFGASIHDGALAITGSDPFSEHFNPSTSAPAEFRIQLAGGDAAAGNGDGRLTIQEALDADATDLITTSIGAFAFAELPAFFPTRSNPIGDFSVKADLVGLTEWLFDDSGFSTSRTDTGVSVTSNGVPVMTAETPEFPEINLGDNLLALVGGWEGVFNIVIDAMQGEVLGVHIPLIGDALGDEARWLEDIRDSVVDTFGAADGSNPTLEMVTEVLFAALGPVGVNLLMDDNADGAVTRDDIGLTLETGAGSIITGVLFQLPLGRHGQLLSESIAFDVGLPGLGLEVDGNVRLEADFLFHLGIGISLEDGVYIDTSADEELSISITATTPGLQAKGTLGFLQLDVTDNAASPTHAGASFSVDLRDLNDDNRLTLSEMYRGSASELLGATLEAGVGVHLDLMASFDGDANFPRIRSEFVFDWGYSQSFGASAAGEHSSPSTSPTVRFDNVELSLGEFINQFLGPIVDKVQTITQPIQPILDTLNSDVPMVSQIMGGVTWLDLAAMFGGAEVKPFVEALEIIDDIVDVVDQLKGTGNDLWIHLGSFTVLGDDATNGQMAGPVSPASHAPSLTSLADQLESKGAKALNDRVLTGNARNIIQFPLLEHPTTAFQLLLGHDVDLVLFDLPELQMGFNLAYRMRFPPFPILYAEVGGGASATINFDFGYDTAGLRKFVKTLDPLDIAEGFFISDRANANGTGADIPEAAFTGYIYVQGGLDAGIFEAGVRGQLTATVDFNLHDYPDEFSNQTDGKIRFDEMLRSIVLNPPPIHLFDIDGSIDAGLSAFLKIDLGLFTIKKSFKIASVHLLDFHVPRPAEDRPLLATKSGTTLTLNMTSGADHYVVLPGTDPNDSNRVVVRGFRPDGSVIDTRGFSGITRIVALASDGDDIIEIHGKLNQAIELHGGAGNDRLVAGSGIAILYGGPGNDILVGGRSADTLDGGDGDDTIIGNKGNDILRGGSGMDTISGNEGHDWIDGGDGDDRIFGDEGNDTVFAGGGEDSVWGGRGNDEIHGGDGSDRVYGEEGHDTIFGDAGNDILSGANGRDVIDGGSDDDDISGGLMSDFLIGGSGNDTIDGGAAVDTIYGNSVGNALLMPGLYNDTGSGNNVLIGGSGTDLISTGTGNDTVYLGVWAGAGATYIPTETLVHYIHAAGGDNWIYGELSDDIIVTGAGLDHIFAYEGDDVIISGAGNDVIEASDGDDLVVAEFGHDTISGGRGRDILWGGLLPETLSGIDPASTTFAERLPQVRDAFNGSLQARLAAWVNDGVKPPDWETAEAANATGFAVPEIMPRAMNGQSLEGTPLDGNDTIDAGEDDDHVFGGSDQDILRGGTGNDFVDGGAGNDSIFGGDGRDVLLGGANNDRVFGNAGIDQLYGGFGDDTLFAGAGDDVSAAHGEVRHTLTGQRMWGGDDVDALYGYARTGNDDLPADRDAELPLIGDEMHGGSGGDFLYGNLRSEFMSGDDGNDTLLGDWLAGPGSSEDGLPVQNSHKSTIGGNDRMYGGSGEDNLTGGGGDDELYGGADSDRLEGQDGVDSLFGGDWIDKLVLDVNPAYRFSGSADHLDGHGPAAPGVFTPDDHATDILIIEGDADQQLGDVNSVNDTILLGQDGNGQLIVSYNGRLLEARWLDGFLTPLVEQFEVDGLQGDDTLKFITEPLTVNRSDGGTLVIRPLDVSRLASRNDFVGVLNGGPGDDVLSGSPVRDRLDGASGSDILFGLGGDDRLWGGTDGSANDHDVLFAGQGNDDLVAGSGTNDIYAWTRDPAQGLQFGLFVNQLGELVTDNGDLDGDDVLDADGASKPYQPENTGLNRMLGGAYADNMYGGTGLDFIYGNGGNDRTWRSDGTEFNTSDQDLGGESWVQYARSNSGVWYVGGTDRADEIRLNYVTEDGVLGGRHVVTRSTSIVDLNGVARSTFGVEANLDFNGRDTDGNLIWNPSGFAYNSATDSFFDDAATLSAILPPEQPVQAVIIDALGGDDTVIVGETVQATVWISAGAGDDFVQIRSGNALLPDASEAGRRNDSIATAFELQQPELPAVLLGNTDAPANGVLDAASSFTLKINNNAPIAVNVPLAAIRGDDGSFANENIDDLIFDLNGALHVAGLGSQVTVTRQGNRIMLVSTSRGNDATLRLRAVSSDPIIRLLGFQSDQESRGTSATSQFTFEDLTIDSGLDKDFYRLSIGQVIGLNASVNVTSSSQTDGLALSLYHQSDAHTVTLAGTNPDAWDLESESNNTRATARTLATVEQLTGVTGLTIHNSADRDFFKFTTARTGLRTDRFSVRQTAGDQSLTLTLTNAAGEVIPGTIRPNTDGKVREFSLESLPAGDYWLQVTSIGAARYELIPNVGNVGSQLINLNQHASAQISLGGRPDGVYFLEINSPNHLPTVYDLAFDLDLPDGILVPAQNLANTSFEVIRRDVITGDAGNDVLIGGLGEDWIFGGEGNDLLSGGIDQQASDLLFGGAGSDTMQLFPDQLQALEGTHTTFVPSYSDRFDGGTGEDRILFLGGDVTTDPGTGAVKAIPDYVSVRYNTQLHRYEFTALRYDVANNQFQVASNGTQYAQYFHFFQTVNVEQLVIDVQGGDDVVRADAEYKFPGTDSEWGIKRGNSQQGGNLALTIEGGDGDDILYGGDESDIIDGGQGADIIVGGFGDDLLFGGGGNDRIAGDHDGHRTPGDTFDDITVPALQPPETLPAKRFAAVFRPLPIGTTALLQDRGDAVTVQGNGSQISDATTLHTSTSGETLVDVTAAGDLNGDGINDFVVTSNLMHYVFFGPVDLSALDLVASRTSVEAYDLAGRADVLISGSVGRLAGGPANINGDDVNGHSAVGTGLAAMNDLVFIGQNGTTATINVLFGGAVIRDGQADTFWPRQIRNLQNLDAFNWRTVYVALPDSAALTTSLFDHDGDGRTDLLLTTDGVSGLKSAMVISGGSIFGPDTTGSINLQTVTPATTFWLPVPTIGGVIPAARIYGVGDLNGDGLDDVVGVVAADPEHGQPGRVYIHHMRPQTPTDIDLTADYDRLLKDDYLTSQLTAAGDLNKDGFDDILLQRTAFSPSGSSTLSAPAGNSSITTSVSSPIVPDLNGSVHFRTPESPWLNPQHQLTIQTWVRVDRLNVEWQPILIKSDTTIPSRTITLWVHRLGFFWLTSAAVGHNEEGIQVYPENGSSLVTGRWYHVTGVVDRIGGEMTLYVNGVRLAHAQILLGTIVPSSHGLMIGNTPEWNSSYLPLDGAVADVRYFGRALSSSEISSGYRSTDISNRKDLLAWYRLTETTGNIAMDSSGLAHHATFYTSGLPAGGNPVVPFRAANPDLNSRLQVQEVTLGPGPLDADRLPSSTTVTAPLDSNATSDLLVVYGEADNAIDFNGLKNVSFTDGTYATIPHTDALVPSRQLTLSAWIYIDDLSSDWTPLIIKKDRDVGNRSYSLWLHSTGLFHFTSTAAGHGAQDYVQQPAGSITARRWYHVAGIVDRILGSMSLYVNGVITQTIAVNRDNMLASTGTLTLGAQYHWDPHRVAADPAAFRTFRGSMSNVRLRNTALTAEQVRADMQNTSIVTNDASLVLDLPLTNVHSEVASDASGNDHHATFGRANVGFILPRDEVLAPSLRVDRTWPGTAVLSTPSVELDAGTLNGREEFTIELQFRTPAFSSGVQTLLHTGNAGSDNEFSIFLHDDGQIEVVDRGTSSFWQSPHSSTDNDWHHLTVIRRAADVSLFASGGVQLTQITDLTSAVSLDTTKTLRGKTIRIERSSGGEYLSLAEVIVRDFNGNNVARQGSATQSSTLGAGAGGGRVASVAIDGNTNGLWGGGSVTHTDNGDGHAWWQVELPNEVDIASIDLYNRTDAAMYRLGSIRIVVLDANGAVSWQREIGPYSAATLAAYAHSDNINAAAQLSVAGLTGRVRNLEIIGNTVNVHSGYIVTPQGHRLSVEKVPGTASRLRLTSSIPANLEPNGNWLLFLTTDAAEHPVTMPEWSLRLETLDSSVAETAIRQIHTSQTVGGLVDTNQQPLTISGLNVNLDIADYTGHRNFNTTLTSPQGTSVNLGDRTSVYLTDFNGQNPNGNWILQIDTGTDTSSFRVALQSWELDVFTSGSEVLLNGVSLGTRMTPGTNVLAPNAADRNSAINGTGRYVRIEATEPGQILKLADVSVLDARNRHIAVIGTASQTGFNTAAASRAIDTGAAYASTFAVAEAIGSNRAYWMLDLGRDFDFSDIRLTLVDAGLADRVLVTVTRDNGRVDFRNILDAHQAGLQGQFYNIGGSATVVDFPNTAGRIPTVRQQNSTINFNSISTNFANTGLSTQYASQWKGQINITTAGSVRFYLNSDDGSRLFINGQQVILNAGTHPMQEVSGTITLPVGRHDLVIDHFNGFGPGGIIFSYQLPGAAKTVVPATVLSTPLNSIFGNFTQPARTISMTTANVDGVLTNIEVRTNRAGSGVEAVLIGPGGERMPLQLVTGESNRFATASLPIISQLNGTWTLVLTASSGTSAILLTEADLILTTVSSIGHLTLNHAFGRMGVSRAAEGAQYNALLQSTVDHGPMVEGLKTGLGTTAQHRSELNARGRYLRFEYSSNLPPMSVDHIRVIDLQGHDITGQATVTSLTESATRVLLLDLGHDYALSDIQVALSAAYNIVGSHMHLTVSSTDGTIHFRNSVPTDKAGLKGQFFSGFSNFANVAGRTPTVERYTGNLNFEATSGAFAGTGLFDQFYTEWTGRVHIDSPGLITFFLNSDDGSRLYVDGRLLVSNDGEHAMLEHSGQISLPAGWHDIRVEYFENFGAAGAILSYQLPGAAKVVIPATALTSPLTSVFGDRQAPIQSVTVAVAGLNGPPETITITGDIPDSSTFAFYLLDPAGQRIDLRLDHGNLTADQTTGINLNTPANGQWTLVVEPVSRTAASPDLSSLEMRIQDTSGSFITESLAARLDTRHLSVAPLIIDANGAILGQDKDSLYGAFSPYQSFIGQMDNVRIWDHAFTADRAADLANRPFRMIQNKTGLLAAWDFNQAMGDTVSDLSGNNRVATIQGVARRVRSTVSPVDGSRPQSLKMDDDTATLDYTLLNGLKEFTLETRVKSAPVAVGSIATFFSAAGSRTDNEFTVFIRGGGILALNDNGPEYQWTLSHPIDDSQWHDIALVRHLVDGILVVDLFVNGRFEGRRQVGNISLAVSPGGIVLGQDQDSVGGGFDSHQALRGELDNLRIWTSIRTPEQIVRGLGGEIDNPESDRNLAGYFRFNGVGNALLHDSSLYRRHGINGSGTRAASGVLNSEPTAVRTNSVESLNSLPTQTLTLPEGTTALSAPTFGDFNGDGLTDLVIQVSMPGRDDSSLLMISNFTALGSTVTLAVGEDGHAKQILRLSAADSASLQITAPLDINNDGSDDLLFTSIDIGSNGGLRNQLPVILGAPDQTQVPLNFDVLANRSVTGSGDFVVDKGEVAEFDFEFTADDAQSNGSSERWIRFTTLGDGYTSSSSDLTEGTWVQLSPYVRADLVSANGDILARNFWFLNLSRFAAGTYFLRVTSFAAHTKPDFSVRMRAPLVGASWQPTDRDQIYAGEGDDWITGGAFRDIIFGNGADHARDTVIGEPIELRDADVYLLPERIIIIGGQPVTVPQEVIPLDTLLDPAASEVSSLPITSTNPLIPAGQLTSNQLAMLSGNTNPATLFPLTLHSDGSVQSSGSVRQAALEDAQTNARTITGQVFHDLNRDGQLSEGDIPLDGMKVVLRSSDGTWLAETQTASIDLNGDGVIDPITESGWYAFVGLVPGRYQVVKTAETQFSPSTEVGADSRQQVTIDGLHQQTIDFAMRQMAPGRISGVVIEDINDNGIQETEEAILAGWQVTLFDQKGFQLATTITDENGRYEFPSVMPGSYLVSRELRTGWGPSAGPLDVAQNLLMNTLGLFFDQVDFLNWDAQSPLIVPSRNGLWYAYMPNATLLQGTTASNAASGTLVRNFSNALDQTLTLSQNLARLQKTMAAASRNLIVGEGASVTLDLWSRLMIPGTLSGSVFNDQNGNGQAEDSETGGVITNVQLLNSAGEVVATTTTNESGHYRFENLSVDFYFVRFLPTSGWRQTNPVVDPVALRAWQLDQALNLFHTGRFFQNWGGHNEKWVRNQTDWFYILPDGSIYRWNGSQREDLSGHHQTTLSPMYYEHPELLFAATPPGAIPAYVAENTNTSVTFALMSQVPVTTVTGTVFLDINRDGQRNAGEQALQDGQVYLLNVAGDVIATAYAQSIDINEDGNIDPATEFGVYKFENVEIGNYFVQINTTTGGVQTTPVLEDLDKIARDLKEEYHLSEHTGAPPHQLGLNEKWLVGKPGLFGSKWYYILPNGDVYRLNSFLPNFDHDNHGTRIGSLSSAFYRNPELLYRTGPANAFAIRIDAASPLSGPNFGLAPEDEHDIDTLMSLWQTPSL